MNKISFHGSQSVLCNCLISFFKEMGVILDLFLKYLTFTCIHSYLDLDSDYKMKCGGFGMKIA